MTTRAIILGGGQSWNDAGLSAVRALPLMPVAHVPLICHTINWLAETDVTDVTICTHESWRVRPTMLQPALRDKVRLTHYVDASPRGTAGCVRDAVEQYGGDRVVVCDGTILPEQNLAAILQHHIDNAAALTVVVAADGRPRQDIAARSRPVGIYVIDRSAIELIPTTGYQDLKEMLIPRLYASGLHTTTWKTQRSALRLHDMNSYLVMSADAATRISKSKSDWSGYNRLGDSLVHASARVGARASLIGPVLIGPNTVIDEAVTIVGPTTIGADCRVESTAVICASVLWDRCRAGRRSVIDHALVIDDGQVPAGTRVDHAIFGGQSVFAEMQPG
ncbi:MAG: sugar phosphate nucleotidyltransferase [Phycisphaerae bacterium]